MKRIISILLLCVLCCSLTGCSKTYHGIDELMEKAREELPIADADTVEMQYVGMSCTGEEAIAWFISGNEYQAHYYLPMEIKIKGDGANYTFVRTYKPIDCGRDIAALQWNSSYSFLINNPDCAALKITDDQGTREIAIEKDTYPYVFGYSIDQLLSSNFEYVFLDKDGNEIS